MFQAIADPTTNLHQPADTPVSTMDPQSHRAAGDKQVRANGPGSGELSPGMRRAPLAAAANWQCDGPCEKSYSASHEWHQEKNADGRKLYYCVGCTYDKTGWRHFPAEKQGYGKLYEMCVEARKAAEQDFAVQQIYGGDNGSSSSGANDMDVD